MNKNSNLIVENKSIQLSTKGNTDLVDITGDVEALLGKSRVRDGIITLFVVGSTAALSTIEYEPGLVKDIDIALEKVAPKGADYEHHKTWGDDNGNSHVRATLMGPSLVVPFEDGKMPLGTWQQIVFIDFDTRPRTRQIVAQIMGA